MEIPEWLVEHYTIYEALVNQTLAVLCARQGRRWISPTSYTHEGWLTTQLSHATGLTPGLVRRGLMAMLDNGFLRRRHGCGLRIVPNAANAWHWTNVSRCLLRVVRNPSSGPT